MFLRSEIQSASRVALCLRSSSTAPNPSSAKNMRKLSSSDDPAHHDGVAVDRHERARDRGHKRGPEQPLRNRHHQNYRQDANDRCRDTPRDGTLGATECEEPECDHPLSERWMHDERGALVEDVGVPGHERRVGFGGPLRLVAEIQEGACILHVEGLVEDEFVRVPEVPQSRAGREQRHEHGAGPADDRAARRGRGEAVPEAVGEGELHQPDRPGWRVLDRLSVRAHERVELAVGGPGLHLAMLTAYRKLRRFSLQRARTACSAACRPKSP